MKNVAPSGTVRKKKGPSSEEAFCLLPRFEGRERRLRQNLPACFAAAIAWFVCCVITVCFLAVLAAIFRVALGRAGASIVSTFIIVSHNISLF